jgi:hypothetical protein
MSDDYAAAIKARFDRGFSEWNKGYQAWLEWCDELYEPDAHYNVQGHRLTLQEYKDMMGQLFEAYEIDLGDFHNTLIVGDWGAIRYQVHITEKATGHRIDQQTMEFVQFKDNPAPIGARVVEGWALSDTPLDAA